MEHIQTPPEVTRIVVKDFVRPAGIISEAHPHVIHSEPGVVVGTAPIAAPIPTTMPAGPIHYESPGGNALTRQVDAETGPMGQTKFTAAHPAEMPHIATVPGVQGVGIVNVPPESMGPPQHYETPGNALTRQVDAERGAMGKTTFTAAVPAELPHTATVPAVIGTGLHVPPDSSGPTHHYETPGNALTRQVDAERGAMGKTTFTHAVPAEPPHTAGLPPASTPRIP